MNISKYIKDCRLENNLSQKELGSMLGLGSAQFISNIERGRAPLPLKYVKPICKIFNIKRKQMKHMLLNDYEKEIDRYF